MVESENNEVIQTSLCTKLRVCIDYRKLNAATRKNLFSLSFIDQMLERLPTMSITVSCRVLSIQLDSDSSPEPRKGHVYLSIWDLCVSLNAFWVVQCPCNIPTLHDEYVFQHGWTFSWDLHGWFLHLWKLIWPMPSPLRTCSLALRWEEFDTKLEELSFYYPTWNCFGPWSFLEGISYT